MGVKMFGLGVGVFFNSEGYNNYFIIVQKVIGYFSDNGRMKESNSAFK